MMLDVAETIREIGRKGELELDKLFCLQLNLQEKMRQEQAEDPTYTRAIELERLEAITDNYRSYIRNGRDLFDQLNGWLQRIEHSSGKKHEEYQETEYPADTLYHMAVAEQEQDLQRLYPSRFGME